MQKRILSVQDISCLGKCSNTIALPVFSAAGHECVALPTALLSTHTSEFTGYTFLDLTAEMEKILAHFDRQMLHFDAVVTGYFGSAAQLRLLQDWMARQDATAIAAGKAPLRRYIDPVLGDEGALFSMYDRCFVAAMREFLRGADYITPNLTEACLLCEEPYQGEQADAALLGRLFARFRELGAKTVVITGVRTREEEISACVCDVRTESEGKFVSGRWIPGNFHGSGDLFTSTLAAKLEGGSGLEEALQTAVDFVGESLVGCAASEKWYGPMFEPLLGKYISAAE